MKQVVFEAGPRGVSQGCKMRVGSNSGAAVYDKRDQGTLIRGKNMPPENWRYMYRVSTPEDVKGLSIAMGAIFHQT